MTFAEQPLPAPSHNAVRELRIGLVCYGGVSLAVYMHGITKEMGKLVAASTAFADDPDAAPFAGDDSASVYLELLKSLANGERDGLPAARLQVVIDVISGTSAGGINGIFLGKALVQNRSQDALRDMWFEKGDIATLVGGRKWPWKLKRPVVALRALRRVGRGRAPLLGDEMCAWLDAALQKIDDGEPQLNRPPGSTSLLPPGHQLELFVPITDFAGLDRSVPITDPPIVWDRTHRQILHFRHEADDEAGALASLAGVRQQFGSDWNLALGFAARATSSFPGAFAPVSPYSYGKSVGREGLEAQLEALFPFHVLSGEGDTPASSPFHSPFVDGGVLDNFPFGATIAAVRLKPAASEVDRRILFVEPDPGGHVGQGDAKVEQPGMLDTVWSSYAGIPRQEPILNDLLDLAGLNANVRRLRHVIEGSFDSIEAEVTAIVAPDGGRLPLDRDTGSWGGLRAKVAAKVPTVAGLTYATYLRLRLIDVVDSYGAVVCELNGYPPTSNHASWVISVVRSWAEGRHLLDRDTQPASQEEFLAGLDLQFQRRRLTFLVAACNWWYRDLHQGDTASLPSRASLDNAKHVLYGRLRALDALGAILLDDPEIKSLVDRLFGLPTVARGLRRDPGQVATEYLGDLDRLQELTRARLRPALDEWELATDDAIATATKGWPAPIQAALQARDLGFPLWDLVTYPVQSLAGVGEGDHVELIRVSPLDSKLLTESGVEKKLAGKGLGHFGAFFTRPGREHDYLWGRLDAAERLIRILLDDPYDDGLDELDDTGKQLCAKAFRAITAAERTSLTHIKDAFDPLGTAIDHLTQ